jgi:hypothetical protein
MILMQHIGKRPQTLIFGDSQSVDKSYNANTLTANSLTQSTDINGVSNRALNFNATTTDYLRWSAVRGNEVVEKFNTDGASIHLIVKVNTAPTATSFNAIISQRQSAVTDRSFALLIISTLATYNNNSFNLIYANAAGTGIAEKGDVDGYAESNWELINYKAYTDTNLYSILENENVDVLNTNSAFVPNENSTADMCLGFDQSGNAGFIGDIQYVLMFNTMLTQAEERILNSYRGRIVF